MIRGIAVAVFLAGCGGSTATGLAALPLPTPAAREKLAALRAVTEAPATRRIAIELREPRSGRVLSARGAVAILPPRALRMILIGPGGTTALDLWIDGARYRFAVPAIDLEKRGDLAGPREERRGLPVDFLAAWLLHAARGDLVGYERTADGDRFRLRDDGAVVDLLAHDGGHVELRRETWALGNRIDEETISADGFGCVKARYHQGSTGLDVAVTCEAETKGEPAPKALADPDEVPR